MHQPPSVTGYCICEPVPIHHSCAVISLHLPDILLVIIVNIIHNDQTITRQKHFSIRDGRAPAHNTRSSTFGLLRPLFGLSIRTSRSSKSGLSPSSQPFLALKGPFALLSSLSRAFHLFALLRLSLFWRQAYTHRKETILTPLETSCKNLDVHWASRFSQPHE